MGISYDYFTESFLNRITDRGFLSLSEETRQEITDEYLKSAAAPVYSAGGPDLLSCADDSAREFDISLNSPVLEELREIIAAGMVCRFLEPYLYRQETLSRALNTKDFSTYSSAELLLRIRETYEGARARERRLLREYSYNHGDLSSLHM